MSSEAERIIRETAGAAQDGSVTGTVKQLETVAGQAKELVSGVTRSVGDAVHQIRRDPSMESADTRKAALKLLAYIAGALLILNAIINGPRRR
jgi:hypothetical protein